MFKKYVSNTSAPTGTSFCESKGEKYYKFRSFLRPLVCGNLAWRVYFMNQVNSTYADGSASWRNKPGGNFKIISARIFASDSIDSATEPTKFTKITFNGEESKNVCTNERFWSDEFSFEVKEGQYFCWEWELFGDEIPYNIEPLTTSFVFEDGKWIPSAAPMPALFGIDRKVKKTIAFMGDSITAGCGTERDKYEMWAARIADMIKDEYATWNLGLGYGRGDDCATLGSWFEKGKEADVVFLAYGVNDFLAGPYLSKWASGGMMIKTIETIVKNLRALGKEVIISSVPPFRFPDCQRDEWKCTNLAIPTLAKMYGCRFFDIESALDSEPFKCDYIYGDHPNGVGGKMVAEKFKEQFFVDGEWTI